MKHLGIKEKQLNKSHQSLQHAGGEALKVLGSYSVYVVHNEKLIETEVYFVNPILPGGGGKIALPLLFFLHNPKTAQGIKLKLSDLKDTPLRHILQVKPVR